MPGILTALEELLEEATAGHPVSGMKWTHRSLGTLQRALRRRGFKASPPTIARLLRDQDFSLRTCRITPARKMRKTPARTVSVRLQIRRRSYLPG
ncbi:MAG: hypothetical protein JOZ53_25905 [Planctomycetaceae bacterium]|nr:hypothetical protein [Planctomycetaceae bacterium]